MPRPRKRAEINVRDASDPDIIQCQGAHDMNGAITVLKIGVAEIAGITIQSDAKLRAASGPDEFYVHIVAVDGLLEQPDRFFRTQAGFNRMFPVTKSVDEAPLTG